MRSTTSTTRDTKVGRYSEVYHVNEMGHEGRSMYYVVRSPIHDTKVGRCSEVYRVNETGHENP